MPILTYIEKILFQLLNEAVIPCLFVTMFHNKNINYIFLQEKRIQAVSDGNMLYIHHPVMLVSAQQN